MTKTLIVYNALNYDAVIAAAITKGEIDNCQVVNIGGMINPGYDEYIWIGCKPPTDGTMHSFLRNKSCTVINDGIIYPDLDIAQNDEGGDPPFVESQFQSLTSSVVEKFCPGREEFSRIAYQVTQFHEKDCKVSNLAFIYKWLKSAEMYINQSIKMQPAMLNTGCEFDTYLYLSEVKVAKSMLALNYCSINVDDAKTLKKVIYTSYSGFDYHLALRLIKLSNEWFFNVTMGLSGPICYSNLKRTEHFTVQSKMINLT